MFRLPTLSQLDQAAEVRIFLCTQVTDMRKGFDSLALLIQQQMGADPLSGDLFIFRSRGGDRLKCLLWDKDGFVLWYKRLESGTFRLPRFEPGRMSVQIRPSELAMLLEGIDLSSVRRVKRYRRGAGGEGGG